MLKVHRCPALERATLVLAFTGWMDGGEVSTGTVSRLVHLLGANPIAEIDAEPFTIYNIPGSMEIAALFRPPVEIEDGLVKGFDNFVILLKHEGQHLIYKHAINTIVPERAVELTSHTASSHPREEAAAADTGLSPAEVLEPETTSIPPSESEEPWTEG